MLLRGCLGAGEGVGLPLYQLSSPETPQPGGRAGQAGDGSNQPEGADSGEEQSRICGLLKVISNHIRNHNISNWPPDATATSWWRASPSARWCWTVSSTLWTLRWKRSSSCTSWETWNSPLPWMTKWGSRSRISKSSWERSRWRSYIKSRSWKTPRSSQLFSSSYSWSTPGTTRETWQESTSSSPSSVRRKIWKGELRSVWTAVQESSPFHFSRSNTMNMLLTDDIRLYGWWSSAPETLNINLETSFLPPKDYTLNGFRSAKGKMSRSNSVRSRYVMLLLYAVILL